MKAGPAIVCLGVTLGIATPLPAGECRHHRTLEATVDARDARVIQIDARAGWLGIQGAAGLGEVRVQGTACASSETRLEEIELVADRSGGRIRIEARIPKRRKWGQTFGRIDLTIQVPDSVPLEIKDTSGATEIRGVAAVNFEDGSGAIAIEGVAGSVRVDDSSGALEIRDVREDVWVRDSVGAIEIDDVGGSVEIDGDSSGSIAVADVRGNVVVRQDGSGSIAVRSVGGDFVVEADGSGAISHQDVTGRVRIP